MMKKFGIYFHIPFCLSRCGYCDFYSTTRPELMDGYLAALLRAIDAMPAEGYAASTVYFGGGTPSLFGARLASALEALGRRMAIAADAEITLEANPATVSPELLARLRSAGFDRISFGLQDCEPAALARLGRRHSVSEGEAAVRMARAAGFDNISGDMMLATPGQTPEKAAGLACYLAGLGLEHVSAYLLKIEPGTRFAREGVGALCPDDDEAADIYLAACGELAARGYRHYEISNFARPGYESRHNSAYWQLGEYLGIGPAAHSFFGGRRFFFPRDIDAFIAAENPWELTTDDGEGGTAEEYLMLALRLSEGADMSEAERMGLDTLALLRRARPLADAGLLDISGGRISMTERGWLLSNPVTAELLGG